MQQGFEFEIPEKITPATRLTVKTPLGEIDVSVVLVLDDGYPGGAVAFTDSGVVDGMVRQRKLNAIRLRMNGAWIDSDGESVADQHGQLTPQSVQRALHKALAQKLRLDTEYVDMFSRAE
ncbi:hypothetical protein [Variovorax ginsengisoli]|uniref:Uncharacterized protein n=1 Tax=Variovorax ginsengisoli TaxID=363844 RepID=A0ABT8RZE5_9BURK|nr:hypothetical protein [Variovorax ginsengisoli]MDN8612780.1 hypothetical protein [Variovorax ginsengisoli]MDO1531950.1 hypothetical protein [Variovorax ginsengisoli]